MDIIIYDQENTVPAIIMPSPENQIPLTTLAEQVVPAGRPWKIVDSSSLPSDRTFRDAWNYTDMQVNMPKARNIWKDYLRELRKPVLEALDAKFLKALEDGDVGAQNSIKSRKQLLRDAPALPSIASASTPEQLKAVMPTAITDPV